MSPTIDHLTDYDECRKQPSQQSRRRLAWSVSSTSAIIGKGQRLLDQGRTTSACDVTPATRTRRKRAYYHWFVVAVPYIILFGTATNTAVVVQVTALTSGPRLNLRSSSTTTGRQWSPCYRSATTTTTTSNHRNNLPALWLASSSSSSLENATLTTVVPEESLVENDLSGVPEKEEKPTVSTTPTHSAAPILEMTTTTVDQDDPNENGIATRPTNHKNAFQALVQDRIILGMELTPEITAIITVYFVQGALGLARLAKTYLLKDELQLGPAELSALTGLFALPWTIKPLYGFLSDGFPLWGYRRKTYLMAAGLLGSASYALLGWTPFWDSVVVPMTGSAIPGSVAAILLGSACVAMSDVVTDGIVVTRTRQAQNDPAVAGGLQSLCWGASATGSILSAYFSGSLLETMSVRSVFALTAVLPLLVAIIAFQVDETPVGATVIQPGVTGTTTTSATTTTTIPPDAAATVLLKDDLVMVNNHETTSDHTVAGDIKQQIEALWGAFRQDSIWKPALFIFLWQSTPTADGAFFFFLSNEMKFGPEFMGRVSLLSSVATLVGVALYNQYLKKVPIKDILFWSSIASVPLGLVPVLLVTHVNQALGIPDQALIYGDDVVLAALGEMAFLPTLVLAAKLCPPGIEAVLFATLMSIFNGASTLGTELGAGLTKLFGITETNFENLSALLIFCNLTSLYPLLFIGWLDNVGSQSEEQLNEIVAGAEGEQSSD